MALLKQALAILGTVVTIAMIVAIVSPKTAQAVAAAFVQIQPGTTTHVGQNETQLVSLECNQGVDGCASITPQGYYGGEYTVPSGYTLIVTDWQFYYSGSPLTPGVVALDSLLSVQVQGSFAVAYATTDASGHYGANVRFTTGVRYASGTTVSDENATKNQGFATVQGYLVPN